MVSSNFDFKRKTPMIIGKSLKGVPIKAIGIKDNMVVVEWEGVICLLDQILKFNPANYKIDQQKISSFVSACVTVGSSTQETTPP